MSKAYDPPGAVTSLSRSPTDKGAPGAVTIREIEDRLAELNPTWSPDAVRIGSVLFAILKEGDSIRKLLAFTRYPSDFLLRHVEILRSRGELFTGTLSTQFLLSQCPGAEDLIERISGQRIIGKERTKMHSNSNSHESAPEICQTEGCGKAKGHMGRCKGTQVGTRLSPSERAKRGAAARWAKAGKKAGRKAKSADRNGHKRPRASVEKQAEIETKVDFFIAYVDDEVEVKLRGDSMAKLHGAMEMIGKIRGGGSNA